MSDYLPNIKNLNIGDTITINIYHEASYIVDVSDKTYYEEEGCKLSSFDLKVVCKEIRTETDDCFEDTRPFLRVYAIYEDQPCRILENYLHKINEGRIEVQSSEELYYLAERAYEWLGNYKDYKGNWGRWIGISKIQDFYKKRLSPEKDGCNCRVCKQFFFMAAPDSQGDGKLTCYSCKNNPMRAYY
jgi:hypothetical protein